MRFVMIYFWILLKKTIESSLKEMFTKVGDNIEIRYQIKVVWDLSIFTLINVFYN